MSHLCLNFWAKWSRRSNLVIKQKFYQCNSVYSFKKILPHFHITLHSLYSMCSLIWCQCRLLRTGVMWSCVPVPVTSKATGKCLIIVVVVVVIMIRVTIIAQVKKRTHKIFIKSGYQPVAGSYRITPIIIIIIIIISLTSIFFQDKSRVWTAASQQHVKCFTNTVQVALT